MRDLMSSSPNDNKVIRHVCNVRIVHVWKAQVTVFQYKKSPPKMVIMIYWKYSFDRNDESELAILPQKCDRSPEWWSNRTGDRLWYGFDLERIRAEKIDRNDDLTALVIWPEGESILYNVWDF